MATKTREQEAPAPKAKRSFQFPSAVTTLVIVTLLVWIAALFIPSGVYKETPDGTPIPGSYHRVPSPLSFGGKLIQLILAPVNGTYGLTNPTTGVVDTETLGRRFGQIGVIFFIMAIGAFISVSFSTKAPRHGGGGAGQPAALEGLIGAGAADMLGPAMVVLLAGGVSVIMTNTQTLDTILIMSVRQD